MRIALDCRIAHYTRGGTAVYTRRLSQALLGLPQAAADRWLLLEAAASTAKPLPGARLAHLRTPSHHRLEPLVLSIELLRFPIDVLHSTDYIPPPIRRCKSVITVHDLAFLRWPEFLTPDSRAYFNGRIRGAVRSADHIIAVSIATKRDLVELLQVPPSRITVIHEAAGFDLTPASTEEQAIARDTWALPPRYVLYAGTIEPRKNLVRLVRAFADVRRAGYDGKLLLAGSRGWLAEPVFTEIDTQGLTDAVELRELHSANAAATYTCAEAFAIPSLYEGFGLPLLEALSCGLPALTSNRSSLPEIAGDAALLVDPEDQAAISQGLERLLTDQALRQRLRAAGPIQAARFTWQQAAFETLRVYHRLA